MTELKWKMFDNNLNFGDMEISNLFVAFKISGIKTDMHVTLKTIFVNYAATSTANTTINSAYKQIISCTADENAENFIDFKLVFFDVTTSADLIKSSELKFRDKIFLNIGKIKVICLVKFVNELFLFIEPIVTFIEPVSNFTEQLTDLTGQAVNKAITKYQETQYTEESTKQITLDIEVSSPLVVIPQNSTKNNAFLVELGNLSVTNKFEQTKNNNLIDCIKLKLTDVKIKRIKVLVTNETMEYVNKEDLFKPVNVTAIVIRTITALDWSNLVKLKIKVEITNLDSCFSIVSAQLLFAILDENLNEGFVGDIGNELTTASVKPSTVSIKPVPTKIEKVQELKSDGSKDMKIIIELKEIKIKIIEFLHKSPDKSKKKECIDFSQLLINRVEFTFLKYDSVEWDAIFKMKALYLKDLRPESNLAVKEMFLPINTNEYFINLIYSNKNTNESVLDFTIDYLRINLCLPYVLKLYQMAMEAINSPNKDKKQQQTIYNTNNKNNKIESDLVSIRSTATVNINQNNNNNNKSVLRAKARINLPEIILLAEPENPNSMILFMNVRFIIDIYSETPERELNRNRKC